MCGTENGRWRITEDEFARVIFAAFVHPTEWASLTGLAYRIRHEVLQQSDFWKFFHLRETDIEHAQPIAAPSSHGDPDLRSRLTPGRRIHLSTDGYGTYEPVVDALWRGNIDYGQVIKDYSGSVADENHRYSPPSCKVIEKRKIIGNPDEALVSTSYVERQNLSMRMGNRRFTRLTNAHSKRIENHTAALAIYFFHYNICRPHETLTKAAHAKTTPAMAAGVESHPWSVSQLCELLED